MQAERKTEQELIDLVIINDLLPEDYSAARDLHRQAVKVNGWRHFSLDEAQYKLQEIEESSYSQRLSEEHVLAAHIFSTLVGTASWMPATNQKDEALITDIFSHPLFTGSGIATALIRTIEQAAFDKGYRRLTVHSNLNARRFFQKQGYVSDGFLLYKTNSHTDRPLHMANRSING
jgi:GNAT superfamily N-acetyltransferase